MKRIAIIGGGISGLTAAYELELARKRGADIDWHLYEASNRLGGIIETTRHSTPEGEFILEGGPDGWVSEKPWARELAIELGLESELIYSNDATRKTYILIDGKLQPIPDRMRMMVPEDLNALDNSPLFSESAKQAYANELTHAEELKTQAPSHDESVASFVRRHFSDEVLDTLAAPLLSGVFGGDVDKLSVRAVMPQFVAMEREHGSLIAALQQRQRSSTSTKQPIFTSLRRGVRALAEGLSNHLSYGRLHLHTAVTAIERSPSGQWNAVVQNGSTAASEIRTVDDVVVATSMDATQHILNPIVPDVAALMPAEASSAVLVVFCWPAVLAESLTVPQGFGFLVPPEANLEKPQLLAATFVDRKFPDRAPKDARVIRAFFGSGSSERFASISDNEVAAIALEELRAVMGPLPDPAIELTTVHRWPRSLPQYEVGHLERIAEIDRLVAEIPGLHLLGNSYRGVGIPDLIRDARALARKLCS